MITSELLAKIFPGTNRKQRDRFIDAFNKFLPLYGIDTYLRVCAFLANGGVETDYLRTTTEYASGADYQGRQDLGNVYPGDGRRFKGRGFTQTTGRYNYSRVNQSVGKRLGIDFLKNPERLADIDIAVESACIFWKENKLAPYADRGEFKQLSGIVNKGSAKATPLHWSKRNELYQVCRFNVPKNFSFAQPATETKPANTPTPAPQNTPQPAPIENQPATEEKSQTQLKEFADKYLKHTPMDSLKNVLLVVLGRIGSAVLLVWNLGLGGQALLVLIALAILIPALYALYYYKSRIIGWIKTIADSFLGNG